MRDPTDADKKVIARLVAQLGRDVVCELARTVPEPRPRGQPRKSLDNEFLQMMTAQLLDEAVAFAREAGEARPAEAVTRAYYERESLHSPGDFGLYQDRLDQWRNVGKQLLRTYGDDPRWHEWRDHFYDLSIPEFDAIYEKADAKTQLGVYYIWREFYAAAFEKRGEL